MCEFTNIYEQKEYFGFPDKYVGLPLEDICRLLREYINDGLP